MRHMVTMALLRHRATAMPSPAAFIFMIWDGRLSIPLAAMREAS